MMHAMVHAWTHGARCDARCSVNAVEHGAVHGAVHSVVHSVEALCTGLMDEARDVLKLRVELRRPGAQHRQGKEAHLRGEEG